RDTRTTASITSRQRRARSSSCSMMSRRRLRFCDLSRNSIAAQRTRRKRMRLIRWMMIGTLIRAEPARRNPGLRNSNIGTRLRGRFQGHAVVQELAQDGVEAIAGAHHRVVDPLTGAAAPDLDQVLLQRLQVAVAQGTGVAEQVRQLLHPLEAGGAREGERQLVVIEDVEDEDVVAAVPQHFQAAEERLAI